jgi:hypothetical protein
MSGHCSFGVSGTVSSPAKASMAAEAHFFSYAIMSRWAQEDGACG